MAATQTKVYDLKVIAVPKMAMLRAEVLKPVVKAYPKNYGKDNIIRYSSQYSKADVMRILFRANNYEM